MAVLDKSKVFYCGLARFELVDLSYCMCSIVVMVQCRTESLCVVVVRIGAPLYW